MLHGIFCLKPTSCYKQLVDALRSSRLKQLAKHDGTHFLQGSVGAVSMAAAMAATMRPLARHLSATCLSCLLLQSL